RALVRVVEEMNHPRLVGLGHDGPSTFGDAYRRHLAAEVLGFCRRWAQEQRAQEGKSRPGLRNCHGRYSPRRSGSISGRASAINHYNGQAYLSPASEAVSKTVVKRGPAKRARNRLGSARKSKPG